MTSINLRGGVEGLSVQVLVWTEPGRCSCCGADATTCPVTPKRIKQLRKENNQSAQDSCQVEMLVCQIFVSCDLYMIQIAVLITNGRSDDPVEAAATLVADNGISLFAVGKCRAERWEFFWHAHFYLRSAGLSVCSYCRNSCPVHLNSLDSGRVLASACKLVVFECLEALVQAEQYLPSMYVRMCLRYLCAIYIKVPLPTLWVE